MDQGRILNFRKGFLIVLAFFCVLFFIVLIYRSPIFAVLNDLALIPTDDHLTEIYFDNPTMLPKKITSGEIISFSFVIHNLEGRDMEYPYAVYLTPSGSASRVIVNGSIVNIHNKESKTVLVSFVPSSPHEQETVIVELTNTHQEIRFLLTRTPLNKSAAANQ